MHNPLYSSCAVSTNLRPLKLPPAYSPDATLIYEVVSLRDENAELKQSLGKAQHTAKAREKELRAEAKESDDAKAFEWEAAQVCHSCQYRSWQLRRCHRHNCH